MVIPPAIVNNGKTFIGPSADAPAGYAWTTDGAGNIVLAALPSATNFAYTLAMTITRGVG